MKPNRHLDCEIKLGPDAQGKIPGREARALVVHIAAPVMVVSVQWSDRVMAERATLWDTDIYSCERSDKSAFIEHVIFWAPTGGEATYSLLRSD